VRAAGDPSDPVHFHFHHLLQTDLQVHVPAPTRRSASSHLMFQGHEGFILRMPLLTLRGESASMKAVAPGSFCAGLKRTVE
jgi:hypothetical protein